MMSYSFSACFWRNKSFEHSYFGSAFQNALTEGPSECVFVTIMLFLYRHSIMSGSSIWGLGSSFGQLGACGTPSYTFQDKSVSFIPKIHPFKANCIDEY